MIDSKRELGSKRGVYRASLSWLLFAVLAVPLFLAVIGAVVFTVGSTVSILKNGDSASTLTSPLGALVVLGLIAFLIGAVIRSHFRKWYATRSAKLSTYEKGFTYEDKNKSESCSWQEIERFDFRTIQVASKHSPPRKVSVIRSIIKKDGTVIGLPDTFNLTLLTGLMKFAKQNGRL